MKKKRSVGALVALVLLAAATLVGCGSSSSGSSDGPTVITCVGCQDSKSDIFIHEVHRLTEAFNKQYAGEYEIETIPFAGINEDTQSAPYFKRLALAHKLPDLMWGPAYIITDLARSGQLIDWSEKLDDDPAWKKSFYPDAFLGLTDAEGHIWGIPSDRAAIGVFWNKELFQKAGLTSFPTSYGELIADMNKLKAAGVTPLAMDGGWVTMLWWAYLIGAQPGGPEFLQSGIREGNYAENPMVVKGTEELKTLQGYANSDSFSGEFSTAEIPFVSGKAAMLADGPWEIEAGIEGENAIPNLREKVAFAPAPEGMMVVSGTGSWASAATDPEHEEAVLAFMKFMNSKQQKLLQYKDTGTAWPVKLNLSEAELKRVLDPMYRPLFEESEIAKETYPDALFLTPTNFLTAWENYWPGYAQGGLSTSEFLEQLSEVVETE